MIAFAITEKGTLLRLLVGTVYAKVYLRGIIKSIRLIGIIEIMQMMVA